MKSKQDVRKQLEAGLSVFFGNGGSITKVPSQKPRNQRSSQQIFLLNRLPIFIPSALSRESQAAMHC